MRAIDPACDFYTDVLGFEVGFKYGEPPFYAEIERDGVQLCMRCTDAPVIDPELSRRAEIFAISIRVSDAKALFLEYQDAGATFSRALHTQPYAVREFIVDDPDGNRILFFDHPA